MTTSTAWSLLAISHILASTLELQPGLILDQLCEIIEYSHAGLFSLENAALVTLAMRGTPQLEQSASFRIPLQDAETLTALFNEHQPIRLADVWSAEPRAQFLRSLLDDGAGRLLEGMQSWMLAAVFNRVEYFACHDFFLGEKL